MDKDVLELELERIRQLPPDQQEAAIRQLSLDYPGLTDALQGDVDFGEERMMADSPEGRYGPSGNPYSVYVAANPLEHLASGMSKYQGGVERREARKGLDALSKMKQEAVSNAIRGGIQPQTPEEALNLWEEDERRGYRGMPGRRY